MNFRRILQFVLPCLLVPMLAAQTRIDLWPAGKAGGPPASIPEEIVHAPGWTYVTHVHVPAILVRPAPAAKATGTAVIICPGGGYYGIAFGHEGEQVADYLNQHGVTAFILYYRHRFDRYPAPLQDVLRAIRIVRSRAKEFGLRPDRIGVLGFSAGGHLASCAATLYSDPDGLGGDALDAVSARPDFAGLIYPVIEMTGPFAHTGSRDNLVGPNAPAALLEKLSTNTRVTPQTPPLFLALAGDDGAVPPENSLEMYAAARKAGVPAELHVFEHGNHGFGMYKVGEAEIWPDLFLGWLKQNGFIPAK